MEATHPDATRDEAETRLPWHKPALQKIHVSLDTANEVFSGGDAETMSDFF